MRSPSRPQTRTRTANSRAGSQLRWDRDTSSRPGLEQRPRERFTAGSQRDRRIGDSRASVAFYGVGDALRSHPVRGAFRLSAGAGSGRISGCSPMCGESSRFGSRFWRGADVALLFSGNRVCAEMDPASDVTRTACVPGSNTTTAPTDQVWATATQPEVVASP